MCTRYRTFLNYLTQKAELHVGLTEFPVSILVGSVHHGRGGSITEGFSIE